MLLVLNKMLLQDNKLILLVNKYSITLANRFEIIFRGGLTLFGKFNIKIKIQKNKIRTDFDISKKFEFLL